MAGKGLLWDDHLNQVLSTKPAEVVQEACQVLEKHGCYVKEELKSELYLVSRSSRSTSGLGEKERLVTFARYSWHVGMQLLRDV